MSLSVFAQTPSGFNFSGSVASGTVGTLATSSQLVVFAFEFGGTGAGGTMSDNTNPATGWDKVAVVNSGNLTLSVHLSKAQFGSFFSGTLTYTGTTGTTSCGFITTMLQGGGGWQNLVRQFAFNHGGSGVVPSVTLGVASTATSLVLAGYGDNDTGALVTTPSGFSANSGGSGSNCRVEQYFSSTQTGGITTITWGSAPTTAWVVMAVELNAAAMGVAESPAGWQAAQPTRGHWDYKFVSGALPNPMWGNRSMVSFDAKQSTALTVPVFLKDKITNQAWSGSTSQISVKDKTANTVITPTSITSEGDGWFNVVIPGSALSALGPKPLHIVAADVAGSIGSQPNDDIVVNVVAYDPGDAVHLGLSSLPNAAAGASSGLPLISAVGQGPGGQIKPNSLTDKYVYGSSGGSAGKALSWRIRVFANSAAYLAATPGNPDNTDHEVERYIGAATYNTDGTLATYGNEKVL